MPMTALRMQLMLLLLLLSCVEPGISALTPVHSSAHRCCVGQGFSHALLPMDVSPFYSYNGDSAWGGMIPRALDMIAEETGLSITLAGEMYTNDGFHGWFGPLLNGQVDSMPGMLNTQWTFNSSLIYTVPVFSTPIKGIVSVSKEKTGLFVWLQVSRT